MESKYLLAAIAVAFTFAARAADPACSTYTGPHTTALVELYTSEGCDSCPAADHWLSSLFGQGFRPDQVVPLALHVSYWDYSGWKDTFAKGEFSVRQRKLAQMKRPVIVYTPQVLLQGQDFRRWSGGEFSEQVRRSNSRPMLSKQRFPRCSPTPARKKTPRYTWPPTKTSSRATWPRARTAAGGSSTISWCANGSARSASAKVRRSRRSAPCRCSRARTPRTWALRPSCRTARRARCSRR